MNIEELKQKFWDRVIEVELSGIRDENIKVVSDDDIDWLINQIQLIK